MAWLNLAELSTSATSTWRNSSKEGWGQKHVIQELATIHPIKVFSWSKGWREDNRHLLTHEVEKSPGLKTNSLRHCGHRAGLSLSRLITFAPVRWPVWSMLRRDTACHFLKLYIFASSGSCKRNPPAGELSLHAGHVRAGSQVWLNFAVGLSVTADRLVGAPWAPSEDSPKLEGTPAEPVLLLLLVKAYPAWPIRTDWV